MKLVDLASLVNLFGIGGIVGAIGAVVLSSGNTFAAFESFKKQCREQLAGRTDEASRDLLAALDELEQDVAMLQAAVAKLERSLKRK